MLGDWDEARRKAANPVRQLDFGRLAGIRADALETQEKLIVEEPSEEALPGVGSAFPEAAAFGSVDEPEKSAFAATKSDASMGDTREGTPSADEPKEVPQASSEGPDALSPGDRALLESLLAGSLPSDLPGGLSPEMTADRLNEKLYDAFGDAFLEVVGGKLSLIEDYAEDLRELLQRS